MSLEKVRVERVIGIGYRVTGELEVSHDLVMELWQRFLREETVKLNIDFKIPYEKVDRLRL